MPGLARDLIIMSRTSELARVTTGLNRYVSKRGALAAEKEDGGEEDQEPMDLDLEQMFEVRSAECRGNEWDAGGHRRTSSLCILPLYVHLVP